MTLVAGIMPAASDYDLDELRARLDFLARRVPFCHSALIHWCKLRADSATLAVSASSTSDESAAELLSRCYVSPLHLGVPAVDRTTALRPGNVLECVGAAGCGKTRLLLQAAVTCILPETHAGVRYGGNTGGVLFLDLDGRLDAARLPVALSQRIAACRAAAGQPTGVTQGATHGWPLCAPDDPVYGPSLERFRLLRCRTSAEVVRAAAVLDRLVSGAARVSNHSADDDAGHRADEAPTRLLLIDNLGAHYWLEKAARNATAPRHAAAAMHDAFNDARGIDSTKPAILDARAVHGALAAAVRAAALRHRLVVVATRHSYGATAPPPPRQHGGGIPGPVYREYMSSSWQQVVTHRLSLYQSDPQSLRIDAHWVTPQQAPAGELGGNE